MGGGGSPARSVEHRRYRSLVWPLLCRFLGVFWDSFHDLRRRWSVWPSHHVDLDTGRCGASGCAQRGLHHQLGDLHGDHMHPAECQDSGHCDGSPADGSVRFTNHWRSAAQPRSGRDHADCLELRVERYALSSGSVRRRYRARTMTLATLHDLFTAIVRNHLVGFGVRSMPVPRSSPTTTM